ncbi:MAG: MFS transporter [Desulfovibrio sp.]
MTRAERLTLATTLFATACAIATLYVPQPLLPVFALEFGLSKAAASLAVTMTLLPLAFAPVLYGLLLESLPAAKLARWAVLVVGLGHVAVFFSPSWNVLLAARLVQGLAIPAALTSVMTLLASKCAPERMRRVMSWYISTTIVGGFSGRFFSGILAEAWGWRVPFAVLGVLVFAAFFLLGRVQGGDAPGFERARVAHVRAALAKPSFLRAYSMIFCCFFAFQATLNYLPFRLAELAGGVSPGRAGTMYLSYLVGVATSLTAPRIVSFLGGEGRAFLLGLAFFSVSVAACLTPNTLLVFVALIPFCAGFFLIQTVGPAFVNARSTEHKGVVNGLYIAFYYAGGALGSFVPGFIYHSFGWNVFIYCLLGVLGVAVLLASGLCRKS